MAVGYRATGAVVDSASTSSTTSPTMTVPGGVVASDYCLLFVSWVGTAAETPPTITPSGGSWTELVAPVTVNNLGIALYSKTGLVDGNTFSCTASNSRFWVCGHVYYFGITGFTPVGSVTSRGGVSSADTIAASINTVQHDQLVALVSIERTTATGTTVTGVSPFGTQRLFGEGTGSSTNSIYLGDFFQSGAPGATPATTITYNSASGNGAALQIGVRSTVDADATRALAGTLTAAASLVRPADAAPALSGAVSASAALVSAASASAALSGTLSADASVIPGVSGPQADAARPLVATLTADAEVIPRAAGGGWYSLAGILRERRETVIRDRVSAPSACPNDGEPLLSGRRGELYCPFDGWRWRGV